jgi:hypothetical protein
MNDAKDQLKRKHTFLDFLYWNLVIAVPFVTACVATARYSMAWLVGYIVCCILLAIVLLRFYCTHCPHYLRDNGKLKCMFFWKVPKRFKSRPEPLTILDKIVSLMVVVLILLLPAYWLWLQPALLVIYTLSLGVVAATLRRYECHRCVYFECPSNCVPKNLRTNSNSQ